MRRYVHAHTHQADLHAQDDSAVEVSERLAIIANRYTTACRDWYELKLPTLVHASAAVPGKGSPCPAHCSLTSQPEQVASASSPKASLVKC